MEIDIKASNVLKVIILFLILFVAVGFQNSSFATEHKHNFNYKESVQSTCQKAGYQLYECTECSAIKKYPLSKKSHLYKTYSTKKATCTRTGTKYMKCECGIKKSITLKKLGHNYKLYKTVKATTEKYGYKYYKCSRCSSKKKVVIAKVGKTYFNTTGLKAPTKSDFGKYYSYAYKIYKNFYNGSEERVDVVFDSKSDRSDFEEKLDSKVVLNSSIFEIVVNRGSRDGKVRGSYRSETSNYKHIKETIDYAYKACKKAGICNGMSQETAVKKINTWICNNMRYKINNGDALVGFKTKKGQCMTYAQMFEVMCETSGISCDYVTGVAGGGAHAWNKVKIRSSSYWVDTCWNDTGSDKSRYLLSTKLWKSHKL